MKTGDRVAASICGVRFTGEIVSHEPSQGYATQVLVSLCMTRQGLHLPHTVALHSMQRHELRRNPEHPGWVFGPTEVKQHEQQ